MEYFMPLGFGIVVTFASAVLLSWRRAKDFQPVGAILSSGIWAINTHQPFLGLILAMILGFIGFFAVAVSWALVNQKLQA